MEDYPVVEENHPADTHENRNDNLSDPSAPSTIHYTADTHEKITDQQIYLDPSAPSSIHYTADTHEKTTDQQTSSPVTE
jgi:hypothetical protein